MDAIEAEKRLAVPASGQWGLVTAPQATAEGVTHSQLNRLVKREVITRLSHGVYQLRSASAARHVDLRAAWLALDPKRTAGLRLQNPTIDAVVSHASAAAFRGWGDLTAYDSEFTFDGRKQSRRTDVRFHRGSTPATDVEIVDGLPVTTAERLVADLLTSGHELEHVGAVLAGAVRDRALDLDQLAERIAEQAHRHGFDRHGGAELVAALVEAGDAQDEAVADAVVRLARGDHPQVLGFDTATLDRVREAVGVVATASIDPALIDGIREASAAAAAAHINPAVFDGIRRTLAGYVEQNEQMRRQLRAMSGFLADPATRRAVEDVRKTRDRL